MKLCLRSSTAAFAFLFTLNVCVSGCSPVPKNGQNKLYQIPFLNSDGSYSLQKVEIRTFDEAHRLKGQLAEIVVGPTENGETLISDPSVGRFTETADGTLIPTDFTTLQATTIYAHFERLEALDRQLGVHSSFIWPAKIGIDVNYDDGGELKKNNAFYVGELNSFILVPYTSTGMPITLNGGILAHEHFHQIFQALVIRKISDRSWVDHIHACGIDGGEIVKIPKAEFTMSDEEKLRAIGFLKFNKFVLRGMNEGLADFWGWLYTGDTDFIGHSMSTLNKVRSLKNPLMHLPDVNDILHVLKVGVVSKPYLDGAAYDLGTRYARFLKRLVESRIDGIEANRASRMEVARALLRALNKLGEGIDKKVDSEFIDPDMIVRALYEEFPELGKSSCEVFDQFVPDDRARPKRCVTEQPEPPPVQITPEVEGSTL